MTAFLKRIWKEYMAGARANYFPIKHYGLFFEKKPILSDEDIYGLAVDKLDITNPSVDKINEFAERLGFIWSDKYNGYIEIE